MWGKLPTPEFVKEVTPEMPTCKDIPVLNRRIFFMIGLGLCAAE
jgi:hypothetical protein